MDDGSKVERTAVGWGCLTGCAGMLALTLISLPIAAAFGVSLFHRPLKPFPFALNFILFLLGLGLYFFVGYVTTLKSRISPIRNVLFLGIVLMLLTISGAVSPAGGKTPQIMARISWVLTIPIMLLGALAAERRKAVDPAP